MKRRTSKEILAESFRVVAERKNIDRITIRDITENCGYSRGVFYNYFTDKYDLIDWIYKIPVTEAVEESERFTIGYSGEKTVLVKNLFSKFVKFCAMRMSTLVRRISMQWGNPGQMAGLNLLSWMMEKVY